MALQRILWPAVASIASASASSQSASSSWSLRQNHLPTTPVLPRKPSRRKQTPTIPSSELRRHILAAYRTWPPPPERLNSDKVTERDCSKSTRTATERLLETMRDRTMGRCLSPKPGLWSRRLFLLIRATGLILHRKLRCSIQVGHVLTAHFVHYAGDESETSRHWDNHSSKSNRSDSSRGLKSFSKKSVTRCGRGYILEREAAHNLSVSRLPSWCYTRCGNKCQLPR